MTKNRQLSIFAIGIISIYVLSIISIQLAAPDKIIEPDDFPLNCPEDSLNCSMIAPNHYRSDNLTELRFNSSLSKVMGEAIRWIESQPGTEIIGEWPGQTHSVFRTLMFRFPDDFVVKGFCDNGQAVLHIYSKSRLGISDIGVNKARVLSFEDHMSNVEMATLDCV